MRTVFVDSFYFFALANPNDPAHARAVAFIKSYSGALLTTGWVITELADGWCKPAQRLTEALTGDHHFEQAGFTALLN